jgi:hypothetical protein
MTTEIICYRVSTAEGTALVPKESLEALETLRKAITGLYIGYGLPNFTPELSDALTLLRVYATNTANRIIA